MANELTPEERMSLQSEMACLLAGLSSDVNEQVGDYHMTRTMDVLVTSDKFWELFGNLPLPYTREEYVQFAADRQAKRDRIKEIRKILGE